MVKVKVKILKDGVRGADDGATVLDYPQDGGPEKDGIYVVSTDLAKVLIKYGEAEEIVEREKSVTEQIAADVEPTPAPAGEPTPAPAGLPGLPPIPGVAKKK